MRGFFSLQRERSVFRGTEEGYKKPKGVSGLGKKAGERR